MNNKSKPWLPGQAKPPGVRDMPGKNRYKNIPNSRLKEVAAAMATSRRDKLPIHNQTVAKPAAASVLNGD